VAHGAQLLCERWRADAVAVTMGAEGALLCHPDATPLVATPATAVDSVVDTCGAGDRFAVAAATALARGAPLSIAVRDAVDQASSFVAGGGASGLMPAADPDGAAWSRAAPTRTVPASALSHRAGRSGPDRSGRLAAQRATAPVRAVGGTVVATGGCFDLLHAGHLATLQAARRLGDCLVVCLNSDRSIANLKGPGRPLTPQADRCRLLAALDCVDAVVVFDEQTPHAVLSWLRPDIWVKGGDYAGDGAELPEADLVRSWGGQTVIVPYLDGRSTTRTIAAARSGTGLLTEGRLMEGRR
jgi:rfaE bifunctional protein nucleotidyltransferase chain/domain